MNRFEGLRAQWEALTDREKRLVQLLGGVAALCLILLPVYLLSSAIGELEEQNEQIASVLSEIERADERLALREAERSAAEARYTQRAPELGTLLETQSRAREMQISSVTNEPEVQEGRFRKRHVRASFPGTNLRNAVRLMHDLESARYPIAIERVNLEHYQEGDHYNLELGVITYDRSSGGGDRDAGTGRAPARVTAPAEAP